jgi:hypothetical protein
VANDEQAITMAAYEVIGLLYFGDPGLARDVI